MDYLNTIKRPHPFKGCPGYEWWKGFMKRWPTLTERKPQHLSQKRAESANEETIKSFFQRVETLLRETGLLHTDDLADRLWNCDETGLCNAVTSGRILSMKGSKWFTSQQVVHHVAIQLCMGVVLLLAFVYHHLLYTRVSIFIPHGQRMVQLELCTLSVRVDGWRSKTTSLGYKKCFFQQQVIYGRLDR